jgi:hypothetical protein
MLDEKVFLLRIKYAIYILTFVSMLYLHFAYITYKDKMAFKSIRIVF